MKTTRQEKLADHLTQIDEDLLNTAYEIDDAEKLADYTRRKSSPFYKTPLFRRLTALAACLAVTVTAVLSLPDITPAEQTDHPAASAPAAPEAEKIVLPPVRVGTEGISKTIVKGYTIEEMMEKVDAVAVVKVKNWLDEDMFHTYYDAEVLTLIAGTLPDEFVLIQDGNSENTLKGYPLFTYGDEFLLFLIKATGNPEDGCAYPNDNSYWIAGSYTGAMEVVTNENGETYFVDRCNLIDRSSVELSNLKTDNAVYNTVNEVLSARDAEVSQYKTSYSSIYSLDELASKLPPLTKQP